MTDHRTKLQRHWLNELRWRIDHDREFWDGIKAWLGLERDEITHYSFRREGSDFHFVQVTHEGRGYFILRTMPVIFVDDVPLPHWPLPVSVFSQEEE